ncbi:MAG: transglycosylase SLT domain-containing protein, partial [Bacteroidetes bacterium]|nr:transglycosylase SLT domain-containing protein [Bacteroidota bacterium]
MHLLSKIGLAAFAVVICGLFIQAIQSPKVASQTTEIATSAEQQSSQTLRVEALDIPNVMTFAGERVPLQDTDVKERLDREIHVNTYWHSNMLLMIKKANRFFSEIEPLLKKYNLPDDFKYLAVAESGLDNVTSHAGASGFWQFMKATGKEYGLEINNYVDERYNLELA